MEKDEYEDIFNENDKKKSLNIRYTIGSDRNKISNENRMDAKFTFE